MGIDRFMNYDPPTTIMTVYLMRPYNRALQYHEIRLGRLVRKYNVFSRREAAVARRGPEGPLLACSWGPAPRPRWGLPPLDPSPERGLGRSPQLHILAAKSPRGWGRSPTPCVPDPIKPAGLVRRRVVKLV